MKGYGEVLIGVLLAIVGICILVIPQVAFFREAFITVILGAIPIIVLLVGAVFLMIGVSDVREKEEEIEEFESESESESELESETGEGE
jgi:cytochrome c-type biogenesis protein CcmH/NrfF